MISPKFMFRRATALTKSRSSMGSQGKSSSGAAVSSLKRHAFTWQGSSLGGGFLKVGGIYVGFSLELVSSKDTIITTRIRSIVVYSTPQSAKPD